MHRLKALMDYLVLPQVVTDFEAGYLARMNRITTRFYLAHIPVFALVAAVNGTGWWQAALLTALVAAGPVVAERTLPSPRSVSVVHGVASMLMGGLLVHFGQGPVQIEMHFYFFVALALLAVFGNPLVVLAAAVTVALHHLALWFVAPASVFNYDAPLWVVLVHAGFVVLESVAACFIARSFHDNVIGLERIVRARTAALDQRNRDMRAVLDNVQQGFVTLDTEGSWPPSGRPRWRAGSVRPRPASRSGSSWRGCRRAPASPSSSAGASSRTASCRQSCCWTSCRSAWWRATRRWTFSTAPCPTPRWPSWSWSPT